MRGVAGLEGGIPARGGAVGKAVNSEDARIPDNLAAGQADTRLPVARPAITLHTVRDGGPALEEQVHHLVVDRVIPAGIDAAAKGPLQGTREPLGRGVRQGIPERVRFA